MPPNDNFNPQPNVGPSPAPDPVAGPPMQPQAQPFGQPAPSPFGAPAPSPAPAPAQPFGPAADPYNQPAAAPQPFGPAPMTQPFDTGAMPKKSGGKLPIMIGLIVLVLALAGGGAWWYFTQNQSGNNGSNSAVDSVGDDASLVKTVAWVEPTESLEGYVKSSQNTGGIALTYYYNKTIGCSIVEGIIPLESGSTSITTKQFLDASAEAAKKQGVTTTATNDGPKFSFKATGNKKYVFESSALTQSVDSTQVDYKAQMNTMVYKEFNKNLAMISYVCPQSAWEANKSTLETFINKFTLETT